MESLTDFRPPIKEIYHGNQITLQVAEKIISSGKLKKTIHVVVEHVQ